MLMILALLYSTFKSPNKCDSRANTTTLTRRLCVCFVCCLCLCLFLFLSFFLFVNATTNKTVNFDEWFESLESLLCIISNFLNSWIWMSRRMNQTDFECYKFDANIVLILIATCTYKLMLQWVRMNQSSWISILLTHSYSKFYEF